METNINREITEEEILVEDPVAEVFPSEEPIPKKKTANFDSVEAANIDEEAGDKLEIKEEYICQTCNKVRLVSLKLIY